MCGIARIRSAALAAVLLEFSSVLMSASEQCEVAVEDSRSSNMMLLQMGEVSSLQALEERLGAARAGKTDLDQRSSDRSEKSEDVASEGIQGVKAWTVDDAAERSSEKRHGKPHISLVMARVPHANKHAVAQKSESDSEADEDESEAESDDDEEVSKKSRKLKAMESFADTNANSEQVPRKKKRKTSLAALSEIMEADRQSLDEEGYSAVASTVSNRMMERFIERTIADLNLEVVETGGLKGLVPYYSGQKDIQTFAALQDELLSTADQPDSWLTKGKERPEESNLLQMGSGEVKRKKVPERAISFLEHASTTVRRAAHKVPDLANYFFGSQTVVMICMMGFLAALFCLHEHTEKKRVSKGSLYEDPLNMSPTPPPTKEDQAVIANLKALRAQKTVQ